MNSLSSSRHCQLFLVAEISEELQCQLLVKVDLVANLKVLRLMGLVC